MSWSRQIYSSWLYVLKTSSRRFQEVFKTSSRHLQDVLKTSSRRLTKKLWKTSSRHLQDVFKTSSRGLAKLSSRRFQDVSSSFREVFNTFLRRTPKTVIYRGICLGHITSNKVMVSVENLQER